MREFLMNVDGGAGAGAGAAGGNAGAGTGQNGTGTGGQEPELAFSQEDLDYEIKKRLGREQKKFSKELTDLKSQVDYFKSQLGTQSNVPQAQPQQPQSQAQTGGGNGQGNGGIDYNMLAKAILSNGGNPQQFTPQQQQQTGTGTAPTDSKASIRALNTEAKLIALEMGVSKDNLDAVIKLSDLQDLLADGDWDEKDIKKAMLSTLKAYPAFGTVPTKAPVKSGGVGANNTGSQQQQTGRTARLNALSNHLRGGNGN